MFNKLLEVSCKKATFLASKKEENEVSFIERIKLKLHYKICASCRLFDKQTILIGKNAAHIHNHTQAVLRPEKKQQIKELIELQK